MVHYMLTISAYVVDQMERHLQQFLNRIERWSLYNGFKFSKVDKKAMIRNRYNRIPHPVLNTERERDTYN